MTSTSEVRKGSFCHFQSFSSKFKAGMYFCKKKLPFKGTKKISDAQVQILISRGYKLEFHTLPPSCCMLSNLPPVTVGRSACCWPLTLYQQKKASEASPQHLCGLQTKWRSLAHSGSEDSTCFYKFKSSACTVYRQVVSLWGRRKQ